MLVISPWESMWSLGKNAGVSDDYRFVEKFTQRNYTLHFLVPRGKPGDQPEMENFIVHAYPNFFRATAGFPTPLKRLILPLLFFLFVLPAAFRLARSLRPDFVLGHSHYSTSVTFALRKLLSIPAGVKLFGVMDLVHTEWPRWKYIYKNFEQILALKFPQDLWIVLDDGTRGGDVLLQQGVRREKIYFLPNGINLEWADQTFDKKKIREDLNIPLDTRVALFLARFVPSKRPQAVIKAIPEVLRLTDGKILFLFAGDGFLKPACEDLVGRLGVRQHARFIGVIPHVKVPEILCASDLFISTSNLTNMSIPTCEAILCGIPVVAFDVGDTSRVILDGETGYTVPNGDIDALARAIADLANNGEKSTEMGRRAKIFALEQFTSWDERTDQELAIINSFL